MCDDVVFSSAVQLITDVSVLNVVSVLIEVIELPNGLQGKTLNPEKLINLMVDERDIVGELGLSVAEKKSPAVCICVCVIL